MVAVGGGALGIDQVCAQTQTAWISVSSADASGANVRGGKINKHGTQRDAGIDDSQLKPVGPGDRG